MFPLEPNIFDCIISYVNVIDMQTLKAHEVLSQMLTSESKHLSVANKLKTDFHALLLNRLHELIPEAEEFMEKCIENRAIFSGSLIMQLLLGETYELSDIDVYLMSPTHFDYPNGEFGPELQKYLLRRYVPKDHSSTMGYPDAIVRSLVYTMPETISVTGQRDPESKQLIQYHQSKDLWHKYLPPLRIVVGTKPIYDPTGKPDDGKRPLPTRKYSGVINLLTVAQPHEESIVKYTNAREYIMQMFDFSCCKVVYDPTSRQLYIQDPIGLSNKTGTYNTAFLLLTRANEWRGQKSEAVIKTLQERIEKYTKRGFTLNEMQIKIVA